MTTAAEVFTKVAEVSMESNDSAAMVDLCTDDVVFEFPFAPPGRPTRVAGRQALTKYLKALSRQVHVEGVSNLEVHETAKPNVAIIEMTVTGTVTATGEPMEQSYICVLTSRDGLIAHYRDYWNPLRSPEWREE